MRTTAHLFFLVVMALGGPNLAWAQADPEKKETDPQAAAATASAVIQLHMMDGSTLLGRLSTPDIEVETPYGTLKIPVDSVRSFTPGLISHPDVARNIDALIEDLGSNQFNQREVAQKELQKMGASIRLELARRAEDPDTERRARIKQLLEELDTQSDEGEDESATTGSGAEVVFVQKDTVETAEFTVVGRIVQQSFTIETPYGGFTAKLGDIRRGQRSTSVQDVRKSVNVPGMNMAPSNMITSGVRVEKGDRITITAEGSVTMSPWGNQAITTPDGAPNFGWFLNNEIANGSLVFKIGSSGPVQKAGSKRTVVADRTGVIYFGMAMQGDYANGNFQFPGEFKVKLVVKRKG